MGNLCLCCYTRRECLKTQFSIEDLTQLNLPDSNGKCYPKLLEASIDVTQPEELSPVPVIPNTQSLTSVDIKSDFLDNSLVNPIIESNELSKEKEVDPIARTLSAPMLNDTSSIAVTDRKGSNVEQIVRKFNDSQSDNDKSDEIESNSTDNPSENDSFALPELVNDVNPKTDNSPSFSSWSATSKSRSEQTRETLGSLATMGAVYTIMDNRRHSHTPTVKEYDTNRSSGRRKLIRPLRPIVRSTNNSVDKRLGKTRHKISGTSKTATKKKQ